MVDSSANPQPQTRDCCLGPISTGEVHVSAVDSPAPAEAPLVSIGGSPAPTEASPAPAGEAVAASEATPLPANLPPLRPQPVLYFR
jgi:hypothetical protein